MKNEMHKLPAWAQEEMRRLRRDAARYRVRVRELEAKLAGIALKVNALNTTTKENPHV